MKTQAKNPFTVKDLKETIRHQKQVIENLKGNLQIMIATVEAMRAKYGLSVEEVHDITMKFVNKSASVQPDVSDILGAGPQIQEQMAKLKETIAANSTTQTPETPRSMLPPDHPLHNPNPADYYDSPEEAERERAKSSQT